jgi:single-strand DNA-binding protein
MADINRVVLVGRLTRDAELKFTNSGLQICTFSLAINRRRKNGNEWVDEANFFDIVYMSNAAEAVHKYLTKGKQVGVDGELTQNRWETQDGQKRSKVEIMARNVMLLGSSQGGGGGMSGGMSGGSTPSRGGGASADVPEDDFDDDVPF